MVTLSKAVLEHIQQYGLSLLANNNQAISDTMTNLLTLKTQWEKIISGVFESNSEFHKTIEEVTIFFSFVQ